MSVSSSGLNRTSRCLFLLIALLGSQACTANPPVEENRPSRHTREGFQNYPLVEDTAKLGFGFYWKRFISSFTLPDVPESHRVTPQESAALYERLKDENTITWIGQSTLLIKINGVVILTDPFFSKYASPIAMGPKRFVDSAIPAQALPKIDIILISHNHYDHLDDAFIEALPDKQNIEVVAPLKLAPFFEKRGYRNIHELDWHESITVGEIKFSALPSVHYSGRGVGEKNKTLWCSWAISTPNGNYFFIGDSAYSPTLFKKIGEQYAPFDLAMVTIGTYGNRKYGVNNHTTPEEAVMIAQEIQAQTLMGIHWGTIDLSDEDPWEPPERFRDAAKKSGYSSENVWLLKIGETRQLPER